MLTISRHDELVGASVCRHNLLKFGMSQKPRLSQRGFFLLGRIKAESLDPCGMMFVQAVLDRQLRNDP